MKFAQEKLLFLRTRLFNWINFPVVIALFVVVSAAAIAERQNNRVHYDNQVAQATIDLDRIHKALEGNINSEVQLLRGLVVSIATEPDMGQEQFSQLASHLFAREQNVRLVTANRSAQDSLVHAFPRYEPLVDVDLDIPQDVHSTILHARDTGEIRVTRPHSVPGGGREFSIHFPVFVTSLDGPKLFWGVVSAIVDFETLLKNSGVDEKTPISIALFDDADQTLGEPFYGEKAIAQNAPVQDNVQLPTDAWKILAVPQAGWDIAAPSNWLLRGLSALAGVLVVVPFLIAGISAHERNEQRYELQLVSRRLEIALRSSKLGVWELDITSGELFWDARMRDIYGISHQGHVDFEDWVNSVHPDDIEGAQAAFDTAIEAHAPFDFQFRIILPSKKIRHIRSMGSAEITFDGIMRVVGVNWDMTEDVRLNAKLRLAHSATEARNADLEKAKNQIEQIALHDALTGLPNRRYLDKKLAELRTAPDQAAGLLHIDLDRFKQINDTMGHAAGDVMLAHAAQILRDTVRGSDFVARIGGDEFVIICQAPCTQHGMGVLAQRIIEKMSEPLEYKGRKCRCGVSVGIAMTEADPNSAGQLLVNADIALYRVKDQGRNGFEFFSPELRSAVVHSKRMSDEILNGIEQNEFIAHYQGQFDARTYEISGVEALARWQHPEKGLLPPAVFMEIAEELNVLPVIDKMILEQALKQMRKWQKGSVNIPSVSVNVSARRLGAPDLIDGLKKLKFAPGSLTFEIVESTYLDQQSDQVAWNIDQIKEMGIDIEIDDFGTGYASIVSLMQIAPKRLKIDRQLVLPVLESSGQRALVHSIVEIGRSLGIHAIAEGVETMEHARVLNELGCTGLQGYALARPMSGEDFSAFARKWDPQTPARQSVA